jgi:hypothetical protein
MGYIHIVNKYVEYMYILWIFNYLMLNGTLKIPLGIRFNRLGFDIQLQPFLVV